jgi:hypothetical protein
VATAQAWLTAIGATCEAHRPFAGSDDQISGTYQYEIGGK